MPTYDYKCMDCKYTFEEFQKMTDDPLETCPTCNGNLKRLIGSGVAPIFKGSGFYQTDYKNRSTKSANSTPAKTVKPKSSNKDKKPSGKKTVD